VNANALRKAVSTPPNTDAFLAKELDIGVRCCSRTGGQGFPSPSLSGAPFPRNFLEKILYIGSEQRY
jgi:hypothetical protein